MMFFQQIIRAIINTEILINSLTLDISTVPFEINYRVAKILYSNTISTKSPCALGIYFL